MKTIHYRWLSFKNLLITILIVLVVFVFEFSVAVFQNHTTLQSKSESNLDYIHNIIMPSLEADILLYEAIEGNDGQYWRFFNTSGLSNSNPLEAIFIIDHNKKIIVSSDKNFQGTTLEDVKNNYLYKYLFISSRELPEGQLNVVTLFNDAHFHFLLDRSKPYSIIILIFSVFAFFGITLSLQKFGDAIKKRNPNLIKGKGAIQQAILEMINYIAELESKQESLNKFHQIQLTYFKEQVTTLTQQSQQQTEKLTGQSMASAEISIPVIQDSHLPEATQTTLTQIHQNVALLHHSLDIKDEAIDTMTQTVSHLSNDFAHIADTLQTQANTRDASGLSASAGTFRDKMFTHELTSSFPESSSLLEMVQGVQQQTDHLKAVGLPVLEANLQHLEMLKDPVEYVGMAGKRVKIEDHRDFRFRTLPLNFEPGQEVSILIFDELRDSERAYQQFLDNELVQNYFGCQPQFRYKILGRKSSVHRIVDIVDDLNPDLVFLDPHIPADTKPHSKANLTHGLKALLDLYKNYETLPVVVLSQHTNPVLTSRCLGLGARGVIPKRHSDWQLSFLLDRILQNDLVVSGASGLNYMTLAKSQVGLSPEEMNVLDLMALGLTNKEIGKTLGKTEGTVKGQVKSIRAKLRISEGRLLSGLFGKWISG